LWGVDLVVLGLAAVDGLHEQGVAQDKLDLVLGAEIGHQLPSEHALASDHQIFAERRQSREQLLRLATMFPVQDDLAVAVEHRRRKGFWREDRCRRKTDGTGCRSASCPPLRDGRCRSPDRGCRARLG